MIVSEKPPTVRMLYFDGEAAYTDLLGDAMRVICDFRALATLRQDFPPDPYVPETFAQACQHVGESFAELLPGLRQALDIRGAYGRLIVVEGAPKRLERAFWALHDGLSHKPPTAEVWEWLDGMRVLGDLATDLDELSGKTRFGVDWVDLLATAINFWGMTPDANWPFDVSLALPDSP